MSSQTVLRNTLTWMIIIYILIKSLKAPEYLRVLLFWTSLVWNYDISFQGIMSLYEAYSSTPDYCSEEGQQDVATQLTHVTSFIITFNYNFAPLPFQCLFVERGKPEYPEKNVPLGAKTRTNTSTHIYNVESGNRTRATLLGGECSHHCSIPAPLKSSVQK